MERNGQTGDFNLSDRFGWFPRKNSGPELSILKSKFVDSCVYHRITNFIWNGEKCLCNEAFPSSPTWVSPVTTKRQRTIFQLFILGLFRIRTRTHRDMCCKRIDSNKRALLIPRVHPSVSQSLISSSSRRRRRPLLAVAPHVCVCVCACDRVKAKKLLKVFCGRRRRRPNSIYIGGIRVVVDEELFGGRDGPI